MEAGAGAIEGDVRGERVDKLVLRHERVGERSFGREIEVGLGHFSTQVTETMAVVK